MKKPIFARKTPIWLVVFLLCALFSLVLLNRYNKHMRSLTAQLDVLVTPLRWAVSAPINWYRNINNDLVSRRMLINDNKHLQATQFLLQAKLQRFYEVEQQNAQLRALLQASISLKVKTVVAQLMAVSLLPTLQQVIVNQGSSHHVYRGQPVLDAYGVFGQVTYVSADLSRVLLLTAEQSAIPVQDTRSGVRAIARGGGIDRPLELIDVTDSSDIKPDDVMVTSGLGLVYPAGYPVGTVTSVEHTRANYFADIKLKVSAHLAKSSQVMLAWPNTQGLVAKINSQFKTKRTKA